MFLGFSVTMMLMLGSSAVTGFALNPTKAEPEPSESSVYHGRCHGPSLQSIRKYLLDALSLQAEPRPPAGGMEHVREQWRRVSGSTPQLAGNSEVADSHVTNNTTCCSVSSEIFMTDLSWDNWVIHPQSVTVVECALCSTMCPLTLDSNKCCQPTSQEMVPIVYLDEISTIVISSVQLTRSCGCKAGDEQQE